MTFILFACNNPTDKIVTDNKNTKDSFPQVDKTNNAQSIQIDYSTFECVSTYYRYGDSWSEFSPGTFGKTTFLYNSTKSDAKILDTLLFKSPVNILAEYSDFFLVCTQKGKSGYTKKTDLYLHQVFGKYLFGISKYGTDDNTNCKESELKVLKINDKNEIIDEYYDTISGKDYEIKFIHNLALKNAKALFYLNYHCYSEIGVSVDHFIVDNGQKLSRLIKTGSTGDGGYSDISTVYLPVTLTNGKKIVLAKNGVLSIDETTAKPELYSFPNNLGVQIDELIVVEDKSVEMLWDEEKGKLKYNNDGTMAENVTIISTTFYQWTGTTIKKIKTINGK